MILLDVNVLVAAHRSDHPHHDAVRLWLENLAAGERSFTVPDIAWAGFIRITTNRRIFTVPTPIEGAFEFLRAVRAQPGYVSTVSGSNHLALFEALCDSGDARGDLAADAYLAALAIEQGATLVSLDRDFARFEELDWRLPGAEHHS